MASDRKSSYVAKDEPTLLWEDDSIAVFLKGPGWVVANSFCTEQNRILKGLMRYHGEINDQMLVQSGKNEHFCHYLMLKFGEQKRFKLVNSVDHEFGIAHRLDVDTSGALLVGKTSDGYHHLRTAFAHHQVYKEYLCLVHGAVKDKKGEVNLPIAFDDRQNTSYISQSHGIWANTSYTVLGRYRLKQGKTILTLCRVVIVTGRTHQIRIHMASIGHPLVGDSKYNPAHAKSDLTWCPRVFLHAWRLRFWDMRNRQHEVKAALMPDLVQALRKLQLVEVDLGNDNNPSCRLVAPLLQQFQQYAQQEQTTQAGAAAPGPPPPPPLPLPPAALLATTPGLPAAVAEVVEEHFPTLPKQPSAVAAKQGSPMLPPHVLPPHLQPHELQLHLEQQHVALKPPPPPPGGPRSSCGSQGKVAPIPDASLLLPPPPPPPGGPSSPFLAARMPPPPPPKLPAALSATVPQAQWRRTLPAEALPPPPPGRGEAFLARARQVLSMLPRAPQEAPPPPPFQDAETREESRASEQESEGNPEAEVEEEEEEEAEEEEEEDPEEEEDDDESPASLLGPTEASIPLPRWVQAAAAKLQVVGKGRRSKRTPEELELEEVFIEVAKEVLLNMPKCQCSIGVLGNSHELMTLLQSMGPKRPKITKLLMTRPDIFEFIGGPVSGQVVSLTQRVMAQGRLEQVSRLKYAADQHAAEASQHASLQRERAAQKGEEPYASTVPLPLARGSGARRRGPQGGGGGSGAGAGTGPSSRAARPHTTSGTIAPSAPKDEQWLCCPEWISMLPGLLVSAKAFVQASCDRVAGIGHAWAELVVGIFTRTSRNRKLTAADQKPSRSPREMSWFESCVWFPLVMTIIEEGLYRTYESQPPRLQLVSEWVEECLWSDVGKAVAGFCYVCLFLMRFVELAADLQGRKATDRRPSERAIQGARRMAAHAVRRS